MSCVRFIPLNRQAETLAGETILDAGRRAGAPIGNACGGVGICRRCVVRVVEGLENLSPPTRLELDHAKVAGSERLACQAAVHGPCTITTTYW